MHWRTAWSWLQAVFRRPQLDRDIEDELRFHIEEATQTEIRAGLTPEEARRTVLTYLGGSRLSAQESCRDQRGITVLDDLTRDLVYGARLLWKSPGFTAVVLSTLAVAIGATVTVFGIVDAWLFRPLNFPHPDRLVTAFGAKPERPTEPQVWLPYRTYRGWQERAHSFTSISGAFTREAILTRDSHGQKVVGLNVTPEFFHTLGVSPLLGRTFSDADRNGNSVVVVSYGLWQRALGGASNVVGTCITLSGAVYQIIGVMPSGFDFRLLDMQQLDFWAPFALGTPAYTAGGFGPVALIGRLHEGVTIASAQAEVAQITHEIEATYPINFNKFVVALASLQADNTRTVRATLLTVSAAVAALMMIAALNVGTLLLGRGAVRLRELSIRAAVGAPRSRLIRQLLTESLLVAILGGICGVALAVAAMRLFVSWNPLAALPSHPIQLDWRTILAALAATAITAVACGIVPALRLSTGVPREVLLGSGTRGATRSTQRLQACLLGVQMAASVILLVGSTLLIKTLGRLQSESLGFDPHHLAVATVALPKDAFGTSDSRNAYYRALSARLLAIPGVRAVSASASRPLTNGGPTTINTSPQDAPEAPRISTQDITPEFFKTSRIPVLAGRSFDGRDTGKGSPVVVLNERAAHDLFGSTREAIGRRIRIDREGWREIVGVVGTVRSTFYNTLEWRSEPIVYRPAGQGFASPISPTAAGLEFEVYIRSDLAVSESGIRQAALAADPRVAFVEMRSVSGLVAEATAQPSLRMELLSAFAAISLLLGAIGVYGLVAQAASQRVRETAIRLALGARRSEIIGAVSRPALAAAAVGLFVGIAAALSAGKILSSVLYDVKAWDPASYLSVSTILVTVTVLTAIAGAWRITRIDPGAALRGE